MIHDFFLGLTSGGVLLYILLLALGSFGSSWLILGSSTRSGLELKLAAGYCLEMECK